MLSTPALCRLLSQARGILGTGTPGSQSLTWGYYSATCYRRLVELFLVAEPRFGEVPRRGPKLDQPAIAGDISIAPCEASELGVKVPQNVQSLREQAIEGTR